MSENWLSIFGFSIIGAMLLLSALGIGLAAAMPGIGRWSKNFFMCFFTVLALSMVACFADMMMYGNPAMIQEEKAVGYAESLLPAILMLMLTVYLVHCCGEDCRKSTLIRAVSASWIAYFALLGIAQFTTFFYYYTPENLLYYSPWYPLMVAPIAVMLILSLVGVIRRRGKLSRKLFFAFLFALIPLTLAITVHMLAPVLSITYLGMIVSSFSVFAIVVLEQFERYMSMQREIARQRASIAVLQMRPHFIHNTMTSIYYLCDQDPKMAQRVTMDFNTYLRKNFSAIAKDETIPFTEELEHTRAYLAVEQAQFESKLIVNFDTPHTQFHVPPLTLQPLAENAVKHGMNPDTVPLHICIRTRKTKSGSEVVVEDNGPGFDPAIADEPHTTLANIRQRLEMMCNGTLDIAPREEGGTMVRATIPQGDAS